MNWYHFLPHVLLLLMAFHGSSSVNRKFSDWMVAYSRIIFGLKLGLLVIDLTTCIGF